jgi:hypothetical protein
LLENVNKARDQMQEAAFHSIYSSPWLQACLGVSPKNGRPRPKPGISPEYHAALMARIEQLKANVEKGGALEAFVRSMVYIAGGQKAVDARSFETMRRTLKEHPHVSLAKYKQVIREQWATLIVAPRAAMQALPKLLPEDVGLRRKMFEKIKDIRGAAGELEGEARRRLKHVEKLFNLEEEEPRGAGRPSRMLTGARGRAVAGSN